MDENKLNSFFETYLEKPSLFKKKEMLQATYVPEIVPHREAEIDKIASVLAPALKMEKPSNIFLYGKTGTGKTLSAKYVAQQMNGIAEKRNIPIKTIYLNCKLKNIADTEYRMMAHLAREFGKEIPTTGLPTQEVQNIFYNAFDKEKIMIILILDEIDQLVKKTGDEILYKFTRINSELKNSILTLVGISNDVKFTDFLDSRVKSSLSEEEIVFPPYNAMQLQDILKQRSQKAFEENIISPGVIEKCAAYAARDHGDARRALELLRVAGEIAERTNSNKIFLKHIDEAEEKIERDRVLDIISSQPKQFHAALYSILNICEKRKGDIFTGEIYDFYISLCEKIGLRPLTQRRISDVIGELDMLGIINAKVISKGRGGRTREITLAIPSVSKPKIKKILEEGLELA